MMSMAMHTRGWETSHPDSLRHLGLAGRTDGVDVLFECRAVVLRLLLALAGQHQHKLVAVSVFHLSHTVHLCHPEVIMIKAVPLDSCAKSQGLSTCD